MEALGSEPVIQLLGNPALVRAEIDRRLTELRADHVGEVQRDVATKELARIRAGIARLIEAYQGQRSPSRARLNQSSSGTQFRSLATTRPQVIYCVQGIVNARIGVVNT